MAPVTGQQVKMFENVHEYIYREQEADFQSLKISSRLPKGSFGKIVIFH